MPQRALIASIVLTLACAGCGGGGGGYQGQQAAPPTPGIELGKQSFAWQPHPAVASSAMTLTLKLKNFGTDDAGSFHVYFGYDLGGVGYAEDKVVDHLAAGAVVTLQTLYLPETWGTLHVSILVDPEHHVDDVKPENNQWIESIEISPPPSSHSG
jgi:hypothetical protein